MGTALSKLEFIIGMVDQVTGPSKKVMSTISSMEKNVNKGFSSMKTGALGLVGAGIGIYHVLKAPIDMSRALGEIKSLDVVPKELKKLEKAGDQFAMKFGENSVDFVRSSYDIQSAITGLIDGELAKFTYAGNVLAKATKADANTITNYMGTMYGIFEDQALSMGKSKWVEQLTGMTATAVKMFKTTGQGMSDAFKGIGSTGEKLGITMQEQMGILGTLQMTMPGAEAGTKYRSFLNNVVGAQKQLGLQFVDSEGKMLPMVNILDKIKGKFGDLDALEMAKLKKAFGSDEALAVVTNLMNKTGSLTKNIDKLGKTTGMSAAEKMALDNTDAYARMASTLQVVTKNVMFFGMKAITPLVEKLQTNMIWLNDMIEKYPVLGKVIGYIVTTILGLTVAFAVFKIGMGAVYLFGAALNFLNLATSAASYKLLYLTAKTKAHTFATTIAGKATWLLQKSMIGLDKVIRVGALVAYKAVMLGISVATKIWTGMQWLLNAALTMNPIGIVIVAIAALAAGIAALIYWYDDIEKAIAGSVWGDVLVGIIDHVLFPFRVLWDLIRNFKAFITGDWGSIEWGEGVLRYIEKLGSAFKWLMNIGSSVKNVISDSLTGLTDKVTGMADGAWSGLKKYSGFDWMKSQFTDEDTTKPVGGIAELDNQRKSQIPAGGISNTSNSTTHNYGGVNIRSEQPFSPAMLEEWNLMQA